MRPLHAIALAVLCGCMPRVYRYVDVPVAPESSSKGATKNAPVRVQERGDTVAIWRSHDPAPPDSKLEYADPDYKGPRMEAFVRGRVVPHGKKLRVVMYSDDAEKLDGVLADYPSVTYRPSELLWDDFFIGDIIVRPGLELATGDRRVTGRLDLVVRVGARLRSFGQLGEAPAIRWGLGFVLGPGVLVTADGPLFRPELTLSIDRQRIVEMVPGERVPVGSRLAMDLSIAPMFGGSGPAKGVELGFAVRHGRLGGIYTSIGRRQGELTWFLGVQPGTELIWRYQAILYLVVASVLVLTQ